MLLARSKRLCIFAIAVSLVALVVAAVAGCGSPASTSTTAASTAVSTAATTSTSSSTSSSVAGSQTTASTAAAQGQTGGAQALTDLLNKYKKVQSVSLDFKMTTAGGTNTSGKMWSEAGKMLKLDMTANGVEMVMLINLTDNTMTEWQPATKKGTKIKAPITFSDPSAYLNGVDISQVKDLGTADVNGETCHVIQFTTTVSGKSMTSKMWLSERLGFPVRVVTSATGGDTATMTMDYTNINVGSLPGDTFTVPADVNIATP